MEFIIASAIGSCFVAEICYIIALIIGRFCRPWYVFSFGIIIQFFLFYFWIIDIKDAGYPELAYFEFKICIIWFIVITIIFASLCKIFSKKRNIKS